MKLIVVTPILYSELADNLDKLFASYNNLKSIFGCNTHFFVVVQTQLSDSFVISRENLKEKLSAEVIFTNVLNASRARNLGISKSKLIHCSHLLFHDCSLFYSLESCQFLYQYTESIIPPKLNVKFTDSNRQYSSNTDVVACKVKNVNPIYDSFVWCYLFKVKELNVFFNEKIGPGKETQYKSGEDVMFLFNYFSSLGSYEVLQSDELHVEHPLRPSDFSKHLLYAEGQGYLFRYLLFRYPSFYVIKDLFLFFANAVCRCLFLKKNSFSILKLRLKGFLAKVI